MKSLSGFLIVCSFLPMACSKAPMAPPPETGVSAEWTRIAPESMNDTQKLQRESSLSAAHAMALELMGELSAALDSDDPATGIKTCAAKAPSIASEIGGEFGLRIGRTSFRLRNPANKPPEWASTIVENRTEEPAFLVGPDGELGAMLPIRLKSQCLMCHGAPEEIDSSIHEMLTENYPEDEATGFVEGDLRGWFWIEVPPEQR